jgi:hypothetical protein
MFLYVSHYVLAFLPPQLLPPRGFNEVHCPPRYVIFPPTAVCVPPRLDRVLFLRLLQQALHLQFRICLCVLFRILVFLAMLQLQNKNKNGYIL